MTRRTLFGPALVCASLGLAVALVAPIVSADPPKNAEPIRLGMAKTFFNDMSPVIVFLGVQTFADLLKDTTGLQGTLSTDDDAFELAEKLNTGKVHLGIFHGHELAWVQRKYPKLQPLMVVANKHHDVRAFVIVPMNSPAKTLADLRGKKFDMPCPTKEFCKVFVERHCTDNAQKDVKAFFGSVVKSAHSVAALDDLCGGKSDAVLLDTIALESYKDLKGPVFDKHMRVLQQSEAFPQAVIVCKQGGVDEAVLGQFRDGLLKAHKTHADMMKMWKIDSFELVPKTFSQSLTDTLKAYPAPAATKVSMR